MREKFIENWQGSRIGFIFASEGRVIDIYECDPVPANFSMMARAIEAIGDGASIEVYITCRKDSGPDAPSKLEKHDLKLLIPARCSKPRLCVVKDDQPIDLREWFVGKCQELQK